MTVTQAQLSRVHVPRRDDNVPLIQLAKGDVLVIDNVWHEEIARTSGSITLKPLNSDIARTFTGQELRDLYFDPERSVRILRRAVSTLSPATTDAISRAFESFTDEQQAEMLRRLDYVRACDRFFVRKAFSKRPKEGYARIAKVVACYRQRVEARAKDKRPLEVGREYVGGSTLRRWYTRWREAGRHLGALAPLNHLKGNWNSRLDPAVVGIIADVIRETWLTLEAPSVAFVYDEICKRVRDLDLQGEPALPEPSEMAVYRWIKNNIDGYTRVFYRQGAKEANHQYRLAGTAPKAVRPLQIVEFDDTPLDILLVTEAGEKIGRAYLTVGICLATRMIVGWHIGYESPSWSTVMQALRMTILPKDLTDIDAASPYPVYGVPEVVKVDNGAAYRSNSLVAASGQLQFEIRFVPVGKPNLKGTVERFFGEVSRDFLAAYPGKTFGSIQARSDYRPKHFASMTLDKVQKLFKRWVVDVYHNRPNSRAFGQTPLQRWNELSGCGVRLPPQAEDLTALIGLIVNRTIQADGISFMGLLYKHEELKLLKRESGHMGKLWMIKIDPTNIAHVWVLDDVRHKWRPIPCDDMRLVEGLSLKMWMDVVHAAKQKTRTGHQVSRGILLEARRYLLDEAKRLGNAPRGKISKDDLAWIQLNLDSPEFDISIDGERGQPKGDDTNNNPVSGSTGHPIPEIDVTDPTQDERDKIDAVLDQLKSDDAETLQASEAPSIIPDVDDMKRRAAARKRQNSSNIDPKNPKNWD
jgi:putative transposase